MGKSHDFGIRLEGTVMTSACVSCGAEVVAKTKGGEARISLTLKLGYSISLVGVVCLACSGKAIKTPESGLVILRKACPNIMSGSGGDHEPF